MERLERRLSIVVPAYREAENLRPLCERVFAATRAAGIDAEMIVVDDDSKDGCEEVAAELARDHDIRIHVRKGERGLSSAVVAGFGLAKYDTLMVMDADLSHPPERIAQVAEPIFSGTADFVVGSRYVGGGRINQDWPFLRRVNSWGATLLARPLTPVRDPMAGFFCLRREIWRGATKLNPIGYKIALELMVKCRCQRCAEVPIVFADRVRGESKLTARQQALYLRQLAGLYWFRYPAIILLSAVLAGGLIAWLILR